MREIVEGVHQLEIPMRRNPLGKTYSYLLRDASTLIDTGIPTKKGLDALEEQLSTLGLVISDIEKILVTHMHTDHVGLIDRVQKQTSVTVVALEEAVNVQRQWDRARETAFEDTRDEIAAWGGSNLNFSASTSTFSGGLVGNLRSMRHWQTENISISAATPWKRFGPRGMPENTSASTMRGGRSYSRGIMSSQRLPPILVITPILTETPSGTT